MIHGALIGDKLKEYRRKIKTIAQNFTAQGRGLPDQMSLVILAIVCLLPLLLAAEDTYCTNGMLLILEITHCLRTADINGMNCQITTKGQVTLKNLEHSTCLWITDATPLFKIRFNFFVC